MTRVEEGSGTGKQDAEAGAKTYNMIEGYG